ncbi:MAG: ABC transporter permease subunit [Planctomycetota bacterium]
MNVGLLHKALRESAFVVALFALGLFAFHALLTILLPTIFDDFAGQLLNSDFFRNIVRGLLGPMGDQMGPEVLVALPWVHPVILALIWGHEIAFCTRMPAAEVDRGTADLLFALPVSRWRILTTETAVWLGTGLLLVAAELIGHRLGQAIRPSQVAPSGERLAAVCANQLCLYLAVGGIAYLVSACSERRGRAVGVLFALVLVTFLWHMLGPFWPPAQDLRFLALLNYYRPHEILRSEGWPLGDMAALAGVGVVAWGLAGVVLARRDLRTV